MTPFKKVESYDGIEPGHTVKCYPIAHFPFRATVRSIWADDDGHVEVEVIGGRQGVRAFRTFHIDRIKKVRQKG